MRRSSVLYSEARREAFLSATLFVVFSALSIWAVGVFMSSASGGTALACAALAALWGAILHAGECARLHRLARKERAYETDLSARLQRRGIDSIGNLML